MMLNNTYSNRVNSSGYHDPSSIKEKWSERKRYWISQIAGWSIFIIVNLVIIAALERYSWQTLVVYLVICLSGILLTHQFRRYIKKNNWINFPIKQLLPRVLIVCLIIGTVIYILAFGSDYALGQFKSDEFKIASPLAGMINLSGVIAIWSLIYFSFHYFQNYKRAEIESYIWEAAVKDFELKTLKSQLNPHFIFNALNSVRALIDEDPKSAQTAVTKLSNILRYSLKMERSETVSIDEEMQTVADYLSLEEMRLEERIKYKISVDPKSSKMEIPPMMIQTLVENGIKHGIAKRTSGGEIFVSTKLENSNLYINIRNSGQIEEDLLKQSNGFGISNTKQRLSLIYGDNAKFEIKNNADDSVSAQITIPIGGYIK
jgi:two-component system, LytTR family, sensor kinase